MTKQCPVCKSEAEFLSSDIPSECYYHCKKCGKFKLKFDAQKFLLEFSCKKDYEKKQKMAILSHYIAKNNRDDSSDVPLLTVDSIGDLFKKKFPTPMEQIDNLVFLLGEETQQAGKKYILDGKSPEPCALICCVNLRDFDTITKFATHYITKHESTVGETELSLTLEGWERYQELKKGQSDSKKAFMAMQFSNENLTQFFKNHIQPEIKKTGFEIYKLDDNPGHGLIDDRLRVEIRNSRFVIVDLTDKNNGAYWEAGYAEALGKKVFYICNKKDYEENEAARKKGSTTTSLIHFDTEHQQLYFWDKDDKNNRDKFLNDLKYSIRLAFPDAIQEDEK